MLKDTKEEIFLQIDNQIATLVINRPALFNALDTELLYKMDSLLCEVEKSSGIRALIITGTGEKSFVAGANIRDLREMTPESARLSIEVGHQVFTKIERLRVPSIAVINGHCLGGGLELALSCDIRISVKGIKIGQPEVNVGMIPGWGATMRLQRMIGQGRAKEMILLGRMISPETAKEYGLITKVCESVNEVREEGMKLAEKLSSLPPHVIALDKKMISDNFSIDNYSCAINDALSLAYCFTTKDSIEGLDAFLEKRPAVFTGK